jgi:hypothetical protein
MPQVVEHLPRKFKALSSNPSTAIKKKQKEKKEQDSNVVKDAKIEAQKGKKARKCQQEL